jgi:hypothetical protein
MRLVTERQRDMLTQAQQLRQARGLRTFLRASRRAERARQRLSRAQRTVRRAKSQLDGSWG